MSDDREPLGRPVDTGRADCLWCTRMDGGVYCSNDSTCPFSSRRWQRIVREHAGPRREPT